LRAFKSWGPEENNNNNNKIIPHSNKNLSLTNEIFPKARGMVKVSHFQIFHNLWLLD
jgi:hypothetical protein